MSVVNGAGRMIRGCVVAALAACGAAEASIIDMIAVLQREQEVPPSNTSAFGCGVFRIDTAANTMTFYIVYTGLTGPETASHIHGAANPGANAGVVFGLPGGNLKTGVWNYPQALEADILAGRTYVNIHTAAFPGGEIRGQIATHYAKLDSQQEVPPNPSGAGGFAIVNMDKVSKTLTYHIVHNVAAETAAHIHGFAPHGANAGVLIGLPPGSPKIGTAAYNPADEQAILDGRTYVNIHSAAFPGGEIRGQLVHNLSPMDHTQEAPCGAAPTPAAGCALLAFDPAGALTLDSMHGGLSSPETAAHIHGQAGPCANAGVVFGLPSGARKLASWGFAAGLGQAILTGRYYINVHTVMFAPGEIRGQIRFDCSRFGDTNGDNMVNFADLNNVLGQFGMMGGSLIGDVNGDGVVNFADLNIVLSGFGVNCL